MVTATQGSPVQTTPEWERFIAVRDAQGRSTVWVAKQVGEKLGIRMDRPRFWHVMHHTYGYPRPDGFEAAVAAVLAVPVAAIFGPDDDETPDGDSTPTA